MFCFNVNFCGKVKQNNSDFNIYQGSMENFPTELTEFLVINVPNDNEEASTSTQRAVKTYTEWTPNATRVLIDLFKKYRNRVGSYSLKNLKQMWQIISNELRELNYDFLPANCENRWKVIERNFKKFIDDQNKTGRGKKYFEYEKEMKEVFQMKKNVFPRILLTSNTEIINQSNQINVENIEPEPSPEEASTEIIVQKEKEAYKEKKKCMINVSRKRTSSSSSKTRAKNPTFCRTFTSK